MGIHGRHSSGLRHCEYILSKYEYNIFHCKVLLGPEFWGRKLWEKYFPLHISKQSINWNSMCVCVCVCLSVCLSLPSFLPSLLPSFLPPLLLPSFPPSFFLSFFLRVIPTDYGSSQARGWIGAVAAGLRHSHSNMRSELYLRLTLHLTVTLDPQPTEQGQGLNPHPHRHYGGFVTCWATMGTPIFLIDRFPKYYM